jgi:hypothetical protein
MSENELTLLERDVERARSRVAQGLARLGGPAAISVLKDEAVAEVRARKEELLESVKATAAEQAHNLVDEVKARIAANPVAALAVGAGLAWRLARHPPIASALIGYGLFSLFRTDPRRPGKAGEFVDRATVAGHAAMERIQQVSGNAVEQVAEGAQIAKDAAAEWGGEALSAGRKAASDVGKASRRLSERGRIVASNAIRHEDRDKVLLGVAAAAMAAALGIAYQRHTDGGGPH